MGIERIRIFCGRYGRTLDEFFKVYDSVGEMLRKERGDLMGLYETNLSDYILEAERRNQFSLQMAVRYIKGTYGRPRI